MTSMSWSMVSLVMLVWVGAAAAALELADFGPVEAFHGMEILRKPQATFLCSSTHSLAETKVVQ